MQADRPDQHAYELTVPPVSDDEKRGALRSVDECRSGMLL
jgi:hypothetical protein